MQLWAFPDIVQTQTCAGHAGYVRPYDHVQFPSQPSFLSFILSQSEFYPVPQLSFVISGPVITS